MAERDGDDREGHHVDDVLVAKDDTGAIAEEAIENYRVQDPGDQSAREEDIGDVQLGRQRCRAKLGGSQRGRAQAEPEWVVERGRERIENLLEVELAGGVFLVEWVGQAIDLVREEPSELRR